MPLLAATVLPAQGGASFLLPGCERIEKALEAHPVTEHSHTIVKLCLDHDGRAVKRLYSTTPDTGDLWHSRDLPLNTRDEIQIHARSRTGMLLVITATGAGALYLSARRLRAMEMSWAKADLGGALERLEAMKYDAPERPSREGLPASATPNKLLMSAKI